MKAQSCSPHFQAITLVSRLQKIESCCVKIYCLFYAAQREVQGRDNLDSKEQNKFLTKKSQIFGKSAT